MTTEFRLSLLAACVAVMVSAGPTIVAQSAPHEHVLRAIRTADKDQLAVSEEDGRFLRADFGGEEFAMQVVITAVGPDHAGLADPIIHFVTGQGANIATHRDRLRRSVARSE